MKDLLRELVAKAPSVHVLVVGDVMLDQYIGGSATRISPEAPVPVVAVRQRRAIPGGAANVAANVRAIGSKVSLAGATGTDDAGRQLRQELQNAGIETDSLIEDPSRVTTTKTRVTAGGQQIVRFDVEDVSPLHGPALVALQQVCEALLARADVCVISDYAKGTAGAEFCQWVIHVAAQRGIPVVVDPKSNDLSRYRGATVITPNLKETVAAAGAAMDGGLGSAATAILSAVAPSALLVTRGDEGMSLFERDAAEVHLLAAVNEVADVTGAGDTVVGVLAVALGAGFSLRDAAGMANLAAGVAVGHHGTWAVSAAELLAL
ncbi:MAG: hldE [Bryobacterales bacterium]|nr:hldE [Bryobacterales bacterium]